MDDISKNSSPIGKIEQEILTDLLDAYERKKSTRRTIIKAEKFSVYDLGHIDRKNLFIKGVKNLADKGLIEFEWKKYEKNNLLERLILLEDKIELAYWYLGRETKEERISRYIKELKVYRDGNTCEWIERFFDEEETNIKLKSWWSSIWPVTEEERKELVVLLNAVKDRQDKAMRYLSIRLFGDSKKLEKQYKSKLISIARRYIPLNLEDKEVLEYLGIVLNPVDILIYGGLKYTISGNEIDTSKSIYGTSINMRTIDNMKVLSVASDRILTIENKATYYEYIKACPQNVFVIYLGGFFGSSAATFLKLLCQLPGIDFYHWSDIDLGGFRIYRYLQKVVGREINPYGMSPVLYTDYLRLYQNTDKLTDKQIAEISGMLEDLKLEKLHNTMKEVLKHKKRLEQECINISDTRLEF